MPIIDWTRTDLKYEWYDGSRALAFDIDDFVAFELHMLKRPGASEQYSEALKVKLASHNGRSTSHRDQWRFCTLHTVFTAHGWDAAAGEAQSSHRPVRQASATKRFKEMSEEKRKAVEQCIIAGLPGRMVEAYTLPQFQAQLDAYANIDAAGLRANLKYFLQAVVPVAAEVCGPVTRGPTAGSACRACNPDQKCRFTHTILAGHSLARPRSLASTNARHSRGGYE